MLGHPASADDGFEQGVAGQPVGAVQPGGRDLAGRVQAGHGGRAGELHQHPTHVVVGGGPDGQQVLGRIEAGLAARSRRSSRTARRSARRDPWWRRGRPGGRPGAGPTRPGRRRRAPTSGFFSTHWPSSLTRIAPSPRTASLTSGIGSMPTSRAVGWNCTISTSRSVGAGTVREGEALAAGGQRVGGVAEQAADAAGGQQHDLGAQFDGAVGGVDEDAGHASALGEDLAGGGVVPQRDRRQRAGRVHDGLAGVRRRCGHRGRARSGGGCGRPRARGAGCRPAARSNSAPWLGEPGDRVRCCGR